MTSELEPSSSISPADMQIIDRVLNLRTGYVLDFSNRTFDEFIAYEVGLDATAPRFSVDGVSKAKRFRRILDSVAPNLQAKLLRSLISYRDSPAREGRVDLLDESWRRAYEQIIQRLEQISSDKNDGGFAASSWTGRRTVREQVAIVRELVPLASIEIEALANLVEARRFNDPITAESIECLRELHTQLGELLFAVERGHLTKEAVAAIERNRTKILKLVQEGAKLTIVAPALTFGLMHMLSWISGIPADTTMIAGVFGTVVGADALKSIGKKTSITTEARPE